MPVFSIKRKDPRDEPVAFAINSAVSEGDCVIWLNAVAFGLPLNEEKCKSYPSAVYCACLSLNTYLIKDHLFEIRVAASFDFG